MRIFETIGDGIKAVFDYIRPGWEGRDGKLSYRRLFQYAFGIEVIHIANKAVITENHFRVLALLLMVFLLIEGLIRVPEIIQLLSTNFFGKSANPEQQSSDHAQEQPRF